MAVASDCNPGSAPGASLLLAMNMARRLFRLTSEEVLLGVTRHAARALGRAGRRGSLAAGHAADFAAWSIDSLDELGYWAGFNPCSMSCRTARSCSSATCEERRMTHESAANPWTGRIDAADGDRGRRWHQVVRPSQQADARGSLCWDSRVMPA